MSTDCIEIKLANPIDFCEAAIEAAFLAIPLGSWPTSKKLTVSVFDAALAVQMLVRQDGYFKYINLVQIDPWFICNEWEIRDNTGKPMYYVRSTV